jgi:hypothetical protein
MFHEDAGPPRPNRVLRLGKQVRPCTVLAGTAMKETVTVVAAALRPQGARHIVVARGSAILPDGGIELVPVHGEFVNYAAAGIWNRPRQW